MTSSSSSAASFRRFVLSRLLPVGLLGVVVVSSLAALVVEDDAIDTALGGVAGAAVALLLGAVLLQVLVARAERRARDRLALDGLEPLRAAQRDSRRAAPRAVPGGARPASSSSSRSGRDDDLA